MTEFVITLAPTTPAAPKADTTPTERLDSECTHLAENAIELAELALGDGAVRDLPPEWQNRARMLARSAFLSVYSLVALLDDAASGRLPTS